MGGFLHLQTFADEGMRHRAAIMASPLRHAREICVMTFAIRVTNQSL